MKRGPKYLVVALACFPIFGTANILVFGPPHSLFVAVWFLGLSTAICLFIILRLLKRAKNPPGGNRSASSVYFKGALVFLFGAFYGGWQFLKSGWEWIDLVGLAVPVGLALWLARLGIAERRRRESDGTAD